MRDLLVHPQHGCNVTRDFCLCGRRIRDREVVLMGPQLISVCCPNEAGRDAQTVSRLLHAAFEQSASAWPADDTQTSTSRQRGCESSSEMGAEGLPSRIGREAGERNDIDGGKVRPRSPLHEMRADKKHPHRCQDKRADERDGHPTGPLRGLELRRSLGRCGFHGDLGGLYRFPRDGGFA